jgi:two-component system nitrogen regulation response regulator GlnG
MMGKNKEKKKKKRILVCDDEDSIRLLLSEALEEWYDIDLAADGREALKKATNESFDLIIIDIKMPGVHGLEAIERIRQRDIKTPIIICSAYRLMQDDIVAKTSDVDAFITKPIDIKEFKEKIFELIGV